MAAAEAGWREAAEQVATGAGFDLEDFVVVAAGRRRIVRVVVDSDTGLGLDAAADLSRLLSERFDELDEAAGGTAPAYTLEVTSPGLGRPLTEPRHFRRAGGRLLSVTLVDGSTRNVRVLGVSDDADGGGIDVLQGKSGTEPARLSFASIDRAVVEVEFSAPSGAVAALLAADPRTADVLARTAAGAAELDEAELDDTELDNTDEPGEVTR